MSRMLLKTLMATAMIAAVSVGTVSAAPVTQAVTTVRPAQSLVQNVHWVYRHHHRFWVSDRHHR